MTQYNIYLGNPYRMTYDWQELVEAVWDLFKPAVDVSGQFNTLRVKSTRTAPVLRRHELLCYVLPGRGSSVITSDVFGSAASSLGADGTTAWQNEGLFVSEVYRHGWAPDMLARIIYHELMHNKFREGNAMHRRGGMAAAEIGEDTEQRRANTRRLGNRLHIPRRQWTDGFALVTERKRAREVLLNLDSDDPLAGL
ncbi:MAG: hypothetical protein KTR32_10875 [Granulosicoccus sp.]|nr:hypothetical protein [Granulosicoccus sp.]